jgi:hypothetical protein
LFKLIYVPKFSLFHKAGGIISNNRVQGSLAVTRSLGDFDLKGRKGCISEPYIKSF